MDISQLAHQGGVISYTKQIAEGLGHISNLDMVYFYSSLRQIYKGNLKNVKSFRLPPTFFEMLFNSWRNVNIERFIGPIDIFHSSDWVQPPSKAKKVTTYHDVVPLKYPQWSHPKIVAVHKERLKIVEEEIDMVIAVSESTKRDLLEISTIPEEKIIVIYEGVGEQFKPQSEDDIKLFRQKYNLPEKFILAIGGVGERKNLTRVKKAAGKYNLVIAGVTIPWVSSDELPLLYSSAEMLLYPSLYEGFGLPVLEAMACGIPVITSNVSSMPEVGGDAVIYVDPLNTDDISEKLKELLIRRDLTKDVIIKGFEQVKKFSWEKATEEMYSVYRKLIS